jgi:hypothetical protein
MSDGIVSFTSSSKAWISHAFVTTEMVYKVGRSYHGIETFNSSMDIVHDCQDASASIRFDLASNGHVKHIAACLDDAHTSGSFYDLPQATLATLSGHVPEMDPIVVWPFDLYSGKVRMIMPSQTARIVVNDPAYFVNPAAKEVASGFKDLVSGFVLAGMVLDDIQGAAGFPKEVIPLPLDKIRQE